MVGTEYLLVKLMLGAFVLAVVLLKEPADMWGQAVSKLKVVKFRKDK